MTTNVDLDKACGKIIQVLIIGVLDNMELRSMFTGLLKALSSKPLL